MDKRIEILKKIASHGKKKNHSTKILKVELIVVFTILFVLSYIASKLKKFVNIFFLNKKTTLATITAGVVICIALVFLIINQDGKIVVNKDATSTISVDNAVDYKMENNANKEAESEELAEEDYKPAEEIKSDDNAVQQAIINDVQIENMDYSQYEMREYTVEELLTMEFYIKVNRLMNTVTVYTKDDAGEFTVPIKAMRCSTGGEGTPLGVFSLKERYEFRRLLFDVYGQYATRIEGQILFHSSSYSNGYKDTLIAEEFNKLGDPVSHGCIRLTTKDAKWIHDFCKEGTVVEIYDDEKPGPLGKPEVIHIPEDDEILSKWDPTDEYELNPWNDKVPVIEANDIEINVGEDVELTDYIVAYDSCGNIVTDRVIVSGYVDVSREGVYVVTFDVKDLLDRTASKSVNVIVKGN